MQIEFISATPIVAPATESTDTSSESPASGVVSFADLLNAAAGDETQSTPTESTDESDDDVAAVEEWLTVPVFVAFVPVIPVDLAVQDLGTGAASDDEISPDVPAIDVSGVGPSDIMTLPGVTAPIAEETQPLDSKQPAKSATENKAATENEVAPVATPAGDGEPIATGADVRPNAIEPKDIIEPETLVSKDSDAMDVAARPGVAAKVASPKIEGINEAANMSPADAVVSSPLPSDELREVAASPAKSASETSSDLIPKSKDVAARFARALERAAPPSAIHRAEEASAAAGTSAPAEASTPNGSSFNPGPGNQPTLGEWLRDQLPQVAAGRGHSAAMPTFSVASAFPNDARLSSVVAASHAALTTTPMALPNEQDVTLQIVHSLRMQFRDGIGEAVLKLKPEHLGSVSISLRIENGGLKASVQAEVPAVRQWLESQQDTLRNALAEQGLRLDRFDVEPDGQRHASPDDAQERSQKKRHARKPLQFEQPVFEVVV